MTTDLRKLQPEAVWNYFYEITRIPRPTGIQEEMIQWALQTAKKLGLEAQKDAVGNVLIRKPATAGLENRPVVTLQAHLDMVPQKNSDVTHDFEKDPIDAYVDGEWVKARGTTLGADNGIGVAMALAILSDNSLKHGPLEALFTVDEEVGMVGANELQPGFSQGDILINIDSEVEGNLYIGCAGGIDVNVSLEYQENCEPQEDHITCKLSLTGLKGGHSGVDIHLGRANANKLIARFLKDAIAQCDVRIAEIEGGNMRNAIPREAFAILSLPAAQQEPLAKLAKEYQALYQKEFAGIENNISLTIEPQTTPPAQLIPAEIQDNLIHALHACQNGVISMLSEFPDTVEASSNLSIVKAGHGQVTVNFLVRSSSDSRKMWLASCIESAFLLMDAKVEFDADYTGWQPNAQSHILEAMKAVFTEFYKKEPEVKVMHAGLECGIIQGVMPNMDMISVGPEIRHPHSPDEKVNIASVQRTYAVIAQALERI